jgi:hypothetical protein
VSLGLQHKAPDSDNGGGPPVAPSPPAGQNAALAKIKRRREALRKASKQTFDVPGQRGELAVRIQRLDVDKQLAAYQDGELTWRAAAQLLIDGCDAMLWRDDDGNLHEYITDFGTPASWVDVAAMSGETVENAHECVLDMCGSQQALLSFGRRVDAWMASAEERADEELLGG